jgi:predicted kinase
MTVILTRGLPASGKSTWAKAWVAADPSSRLRVSRDDIRFQLYGSYWGDGVDENMVTKVEDAMVKAAVDAGKDVVVDATHLASRYVRRWIDLGHEVKVETFEVALSDLFIRDDWRIMDGARGVGKDVIKQLAQRYQIKDDGKLPPVVIETPQTWIPAPAHGPGLYSAFIVDIDGTIANHEGVRSPYDTSRYHLDAAHENVIATVGSLAGLGYVILFVSGRDSAYRAVTERWIEDNTAITVSSENLFMRPEGDKRNDAIVKHELFHEHIAGKYNVVGVFDDRGRVLRMWRAIGLTTFAVGDTDNYNF